MGKIICSRDGDGKNEANIYYLHEVKKVEGGGPSTTLAEAKVQVSVGCGYH